MGCDNDDCSEVYHYAIITRQAQKIESLCGIDISECEDSLVCSDNEIGCWIEYCDSTSGFYSCDEINNL